MANGPGRDRSGAEDRSQGWPWPFGREKLAADGEMREAANTFKGRDDINIGKETVPGLKREVASRPWSHPGNAY